MTGAARGVWAGVLASLLLISPAEAEAEPEAVPFPPLTAGRPACCTQRGQSIGEAGEEGRSSHITSYTTIV